MFTIENVINVNVPQSLCSITKYIIYVDADMFLIITLNTKFISIWLFVNILRILLANAQI